METGTLLLILSATIITSATTAFATCVYFYSKYAAPVNNEGAEDAPKLSQTEKEVMRMKGEGMKISEIAKVRGVSIAAIKKAVTRANQKLAKKNGRKSEVDT